MQLTDEEVRVLGCLSEKQMTTPEYYPLTLNALVTACNQSSNRSPVVNYSPNTVTNALEALRADHRLVRIVHASSGARTDKYKHVIDERLTLSPPELAVLTVLLLRGPQTVGEIKGRTERMHAFDSLDAVERVLDRLADPHLAADPSEYPIRADAGMLASSRPSMGADDRGDASYARPWDGPLVTRLPRFPGQKEARVMHLLAGELDLEELAGTTALMTPSPTESGPSLGGRVGTLEKELSELRVVVGELREQVDDLRRQLGV